MNQEQLKRIPKVELHCHLDGSISRECLQELLGRPVEPEQLSVSDSCSSLKEYLEKFDLPLQALQTAEGLKRAVLDVVHTASLENVRYMEIRFAPLLSVNAHQDCERVLEAVVEGAGQAEEKFGVKTQILACAMRHHPLEENRRMIHAAVPFLGKGLCGLDLAGDEAGFPMKPFMPLFEEAGKLGFPFTIHAGECGSVDNVLDAIDCGAKRIGHGIALSGHPAAIQKCLEKQVTLELCPISNLQTKAVRDPASYPIREFLEAGLPVTVHTDNRTVSHTSLVRELAWIAQHCGITEEEILQLEEQALLAAFAPEARKQEMRDLLRAQWNREIGKNGSI